MNVSMMWCCGLFAPERGPRKGWFGVVGIIYGSTERIFLSRLRPASILSAYNWMMLVSRSRVVGCYLRFRKFVCSLKRQFDGSFD